jgi:hypothetical protein
MLKNCTCLVLSLFLVCAGLAAPVNAAVISTSDALAAKTRAGLLSEVQQTLARKDLQAAMISLGVDPVSAQKRVAALTQAELAQLSVELDRLPAGGDILALIGAVFVVLLILEITGVTNIFNNI